MAILFNFRRNYVFSLKLLLISAGVLSSAVMFKLFVPVISQFFSTQVPVIYCFFVSCLTPPYLYLVLNCIILTIVASSKLQQKEEEPVALSLHHHHDNQVAPRVPVEVRSDYYGSAVLQIKPPGEPRLQSSDGGVLKDLNVENAEELVAKIPHVEARDSEEKTSSLDDGLESGEEFVISRSSWMPLRRGDSIENLSSSERPPVSARLGRRKSIKSSPEALRVSRPKRHDTLENTWKTITEGRAMPLTRHLRKSDTWESQAHHPQQAQTLTPEKMKKSETFNASGADSSPGPSPNYGKLKREASPSQDELNRRVEAFIRKFNEEMRLQRQESLRQYHEMIRGGK